MCVSGATTGLVDAHAVPQNGQKEHLSASCHGKGTQEHEETPKNECRMGGSKARACLRRHASETLFWTAPFAESVRVEWISEVPSNSRIGIRLVASDRPR